jgi:hypothetical protein
MINKIKEKFMTEKEICISITCDVCKKEYDNYKDKFNYEIYEFIHISKDCGYGSVFGDDEEIEIDICQNCLKEILGKYIRMI